MLGACMAILMSQVSRNFSYCVLFLKGLFHGRETLCTRRHSRVLIAPFAFTAFMDDLHRIWKQSQSIA